MSSRNYKSLSDVPRGLELVRVRQDYGQRSGDTGGVHDRMDFGPAKVGKNGKMLLPPVPGRQEPAWYFVKPTKSVEEVPSKYDKY